MEQLVAQEDPRRIQPARDEDWEPFKEAITQLYWTEEGRLREVMNIMQAVHNFCATEKQYRTRFKKWNLEKNINSKRMKAMVGIQKRRQENGKGTEFSFHGRPVPQEKIDRWQKRQKSAEEVTSPHYFAAPTPSGIEYGTPASLTVSHLSAHLVQGPPSPDGIRDLLSASSLGDLEFNASPSAEDNRPTGNTRVAGQPFGIVHQSGRQEAWVGPPQRERSGSGSLPVPSRDLEMDLLMSIPTWDAGAGDSILSSHAAQMLPEGGSDSGTIDQSAQIGENSLWQAMTNDMEGHTHLQDDTSHEWVADDDFLHGRRDPIDVHGMEIDTVSSDAIFTNFANGCDSAAPRLETTPGSCPPCQPIRVMQMASTFRSSIKLRANASATQGNKIKGITGGDIEQRGSEFAGDIEGSEGVELTQGNEINAEEGMRR